MSAIAGAELQFDRFISADPANGIIAVLKSDASVANLLAYSLATGDVTWSAPANSSGTNTRRHLFDRPIVSTSTIGSGAITVDSGNINLSNAFNLTGQHTDTTRKHLISFNASNKTSVDADGFGVVTGGALTTAGLVTVSYSAAAAIIKDTIAFASNPGPTLSFQGLDSSSANTTFGSIVGRPEPTNADRGFLEIYTRVDGVSMKVAQHGTGISPKTIFYQGAFDDPMVEFRSTDVAHGMTTLIDTSAFGYLAKVAGSVGGLMVTGLSEDGTQGLYLQGVQGTSQTGKSTSAGAAVTVAGAVKSGTTSASLGANANILTVADLTTVRFILDSDGDSHQDVGTAWTNFDTHDDVSLLNRLAAHVTRAADPLRSTFGQWLEEGRDVLERNKLVTFNADGHHFVNMSRLAMLHTGAIRQVGGRVDRMVEELVRLGADRTKLAVDAAPSSAVAIC